MHCEAYESALRLQRVQKVFDIEDEWKSYSKLYGDSKFGRRCLMARRLIEQGVPFVEVGQSSYDSHADNFFWHKGLLPPMEHAWSGLLTDLAERGMLDRTLIVWMGEIGRTPSINNRSSLDHTIRIWDTSASAEGTAEVVLDAKTRKALAKRGKKDEANKPPVKVEVQTASQALEGHRDWINALGLSGDQKRLISGDDSGLVIVWDLDTRSEVARWTVDSWVVAAALSPNGQTAPVSEFRYRRDDFDHVPPSLKLYNVADQKMKLSLCKETSREGLRKFFADGLVAAAFSPDGKLLAVGQGGETDTGKVHLIEVDSGKLLRTISGHRYGILDLCFTPDGKYLLTSGRDTQVRICQVEDGKELAAMGKPRGGQFTDWIHAISLSADQRWLAAADISGHVQIWHFPG